jgi:hypothetical protein
LSSAIYLKYSSLHPRQSAGSYFLRRLTKMKLSLFLSKHHVKVIKKEFGITSLLIFSVTSKPSKDRPIDRWMQFISAVISNCEGYIRRPLNQWKTRGKMSPNR